MRIEHVITGLRTGGAEMMLLKLISAPSGSFESSVISLGDIGAIGPQIASLGIPVHTLTMCALAPNPAKALALTRLTRKFKPQVIQGWMYHGNLMASLAGLSVAGTPVLWNIRQTIYDLARERRSTALVIRTCALLSSHPAAIVYNSQTSAQQHESLGYRQDKRIIIPNGFDCSVFRPDRDARQRVRRELGVAGEMPLIGLIARFHPMKDHAGFLRAAGRVARKYPGARFLLAGTGVTWQEPMLVNAIQEEQLLDRVFLLGERSDTPALNAALDIACSSSAWGEGFSNSIGEAMASGIPCVVTDIGDSAFLVGDSGVVVRANSPEALAAAICNLLATGYSCRRDMGEAARRRIEAEFALASIVRRYEDLYREHCVQ